MGNPNPRTDQLAPRWPKGVSGNPFGRRPRPWTDNYLKWAQAVLPEELRVGFNQLFKCGHCKGTGQTNHAKPRKCRFCHGTAKMELLKSGATWAEATALGLNIEAVTKRNISAIKEMADRGEGTAPQRMELEVSGPGGSMLPPDRSAYIVAISEALGCSPAAARIDVDGASIAKPVRGTNENAPAQENQAAENTDYTRALLTAGPGVSGERTEKEKAESNGDNAGAKPNPGNS